MMLKAHLFLKEHLHISSIDFSIYDMVNYACLKIIQVNCQNHFNKGHIYGYVSPWI